ncbi:MAG: hypothetical protein GAK29_03579 [Acinetobacter bereziniae]|uniref:Uncharacterized protein n=1 Tax=Acinetobacter bereziniae TaxID=106648 RepID=A0A833UP92_ACIBZ|nr:MAG: hypothetical protein GAK29_03579 [Acinetobacter bereziniae]
MNSTALFLGLIFSSIGLGYFIYGKKQKNDYALHLWHRFNDFPLFH